MKKLQEKKRKMLYGGGDVLMSENTPITQLSPINADNGLVKTILGQGTPSVPTAQTVSVTQPITQMGSTGSPTKERFAAFTNRAKKFAKDAASVAAQEAQRIALATALAATTEAGNVANESIQNLAQGKGTAGLQDALKAGAQRVALKATTAATQEAQNSALMATQNAIKSTQNAVQNLSQHPLLQQQLQLAQVPYMVQGQVPQIPAAPMVWQVPQIPQIVQPSQVSPVPPVSPQPSQVLQVPQVLQVSPYHRCHK